MGSEMCIRDRARLTGLAYNFEVLFIQRMVMKRDFRRDRETTKVFVLARYEVTNRTANVTLITVIFSV